MAVWTVWENPRHGDAAPLRARFVRDSFSWLAFLFPPLWLLANGMVAVFVVLAVLVAALATLAIELGTPPQLFVTVLSVAALWFGFEARALQRVALARRGWTMTGVVEANRFRTAERRYFAERAHPAPPGALPQPLPGVPPRPAPRLPDALP